MSIATDHQVREHERRIADIEKRLKELERKAEPSAKMGTLTLGQRAVQKVKQLTDVI